MKKGKLDGPQGEDNIHLLLIILLNRAVRYQDTHSGVTNGVCFFAFLQRNLTHTWPWRCRMLRAQPSLCEAVSHAGSRTSCCECFLSSLMSSAPFIPPCLLGPLLFCTCFSSSYSSSSSVYLPVQHCLIEYFCHNSDTQFLSNLIVFLLAHILSQFPTVARLAEHPYLLHVSCWSRAGGVEMLTCKQLYTWR